MAVEDKTERNELELEFAKLEKNSLWVPLYDEIKTESESMKKGYPLNEAKKADNKYLNRYRDVNPYDYTRVILSRTDYDYINASHIIVEEAQRKYILTQGPLPNTIVHFWLMVWEQNSTAIIMLNKIIEKNQLKCSQYWPISVGEDNALKFDAVDLKLELLSEIDCLQYVVRNLRLTNVETDESREIIQYHYTAWPDFGVPHSPLTFLKFLRDIRQSNAFGSDVGPPIVHCSAGIGRSGTFCLVDSCLVLIELKGVGEVSIKDVLLELRNYRMGLIQTSDQLKFSYIAIIQGLKVDWNACGNDGLPEDELSFNGNEDTEDEPPPLPPPRAASLTNAEKPLPGSPEKPLPGLPRNSSEGSDSDIEKCTDSSDIDDDETRLITDLTSSEDIRTPWDDNLTEPILTNEPSILSSVPESRKRKFSEDTKEKTKRIHEKVEEMKKKQNDSEKRKKQRSIINLTLGFVALSGVVLVLFWLRKSRQ